MAPTQRQTEEKRRRRRRCTTSSCIATTLLLFSPLPPSALSAAPSTTAFVTVPTAPSTRSPRSSSVGGVFGRHDTGSSVPFGRRRSRARSAAVVVVRASSPSEGEGLIDDDDEEEFDDGFDDDDFDDDDMFAGSLFDELSSGDGEEAHLGGIGVGIDLGTTNSAVAIMERVPSEDGGSRSEPVIISIPNNGRTMASVVSFVPNDDDDDDDEDPQQPYEVLVGRDAVDAEPAYPRSTFRNVKRVIGTGGRAAALNAGIVPNLRVGIAAALGKDDKKRDRSSKSKNGEPSWKKKKWRRRKKEDEGGLPKLHIQLQEAESDPAKLLLSLHNDDDGDGDDAAEPTALRPEDVSARILRTLFDAAETYNYEKQKKSGANAVFAPVTRAVIGVPAYFTESQRAATLRASEMAGVPKAKLLAEPEAAALAYGIGREKKQQQASAAGSEEPEVDELVLVFDLGGGTFDVSVLEVGGGVTEVLATAGNNRIGGTDFDERIAEFMSQSCVIAAQEAGTGGGSGGGEMRRRTPAPSPSPSESSPAEEESSASLESLASFDVMAGADDLTMEAMKEITASMNAPSQRRYRPRGRGGGKSKRTIERVEDMYKGGGEVADVMLRCAEAVRIRLSNQKEVHMKLPTTREGWREIENANDIIVDGNGEEDEDVYDGDRIPLMLDRKTFEELCHDELQSLLRPVREVALLAGALLPGEARPSTAANALAMEEDFQESLRGTSDPLYENFYGDDDDGGGGGDAKVGSYSSGSGGSSSSSPSSSTPSSASDDSDLFDENAMAQLLAMDIKAKKKEQQRGRKNARNLEKRDRNYRQAKQSSVAPTEPAVTRGKKKKKSSAAAIFGGAGGNVGPNGERVEDGINGRALSRIVLVGGATRMPVVGKLLSAVAGLVPQRTVNPDEAVALGCAVQAGILDGDEGLGGMQVLTPIQAAVMRALARKRNMEIKDDGFDDDEEFY